MSASDGCDDGAYAKVNVKEFSVTTNSSYGMVQSDSHAADIAVAKASKNACIKKVTFLFYLVVVVSLLGAVGACLAFATEISRLKSEMASHKAVSSSQQLVNQNLMQQFITFYSLMEDNISKLNASINTADSSTQHPSYSVIEKRIEQLNGSISIVDMALEEGLRAALYTSSCTTLPPSSPSGYHWVRTSNGSAVRVYCDMNRSCGGVTGGWMRVAELDMTNSSHQCPSGFRQRNDSNIRTCVTIEEPGGCFVLNNVEPLSIRYSKVCGLIRAYQYGTTDAFTTDDHSYTIDGPYVDGVSLTHGNPRQHIWTFAAATSESFSNYICPCTNSRYQASNQPPDFIENDYFCDTGATSRPQSTFYADDPLWDGAGCGSQSTCCTFNNPPWFYKQLSQPTTDAIEIRVCRSGDSGGEDIAIEIVQIYVQ
jgi:hypothetical protein